MRILFSFLLLILIEANLLAQIQLFNDEFNDSRSLGNWTDINISEAWNINQLDLFNIHDSLPGKLVMMPKTVSWYEEYRGPLIYKKLSGDFVLTTALSAFGRDRMSIPSSNYSLAGIMIRRPLSYPNGALGAGGWQAGEQDYIFISLGYASTSHPSCPGCQGPHFEIKTTNNSVSTLVVEEIDTQAVEIRIVRSDSSLLILTKFPGESYEVRRKFNRSDFMDTLQLGFVSYTDWDKVVSLDPFFHNTHELEPGLINDPTPEIGFDPDLFACFEYIRFDSLVLPLSMQNTNLAEGPSDSEILNEWGYNSEVFCPQSLSVYDDISAQSYILLQAENQIHVNNKISESTVLFSASQSVEFEAGFELNGLSEMNVTISNCTN